MEAHLIEHCSPTLASIKTANLFMYTIPRVPEFADCLQRVNKILNKKGVYVEALQIREGRALIWVYRKSQLESRMQDQRVSKFLGTYGYQTEKLDKVILHLKERVLSAKKFPHEIGVFLGYPLADVVAFIKNEGKNSKCTGCWKVYTNECEARNLFKKYDKCKLIYAKMLSLGKSIRQLTVAA